MDHVRHLKLRSIDYAGIMLLGVMQAATVVGFALLVGGIPDAMAWVAAVSGTGTVVALLVVSRIVPSTDGRGRGERGQLRACSGVIAFDNVTAGVVRRLTAIVPAGRTVGITGPSGGGKSTLVRLVAGLQSAELGRVLVGDEDLASVNPLSVARRIGCASGGVPLLRGPVLGSIVAHEPGASVADVHRIVRSLGLESLLDRGDGIDGWLAEDGSTLPLGELEVVGLIRALVGKPSILLLDEPLSHLDAESRRVALGDALRYSGTVLFVSDEPDELTRTDEVWTMRDGRLVDVCPGSAFAGRSPTAVDPMGSQFRPATTADAESTWSSGSPTRSVDQLMLM